MRARDVGIALARNPFAPIVPCHRIVAAGGRLGGYSAPGGTATKRRLLELEGAAIVAPPLQAGLFDAEPDRRQQLSDPPSSERRKSISPRKYPASSSYMARWLPSRAVQVAALRAGGRPSSAMKRRVHRVVLGADDQRRHVDRRQLLGPVPVGELASR